MIEFGIKKEPNGIKKKWTNIGVNLREVPLNLEV